MIALLQRVTQGSVTVDGRTVAAIGPGLVVLVGVERDDTRAAAERLAERLLAYRVFADSAGRMNLSLRDVGGGLLLVPQFTLAADTAKGNRPGFSPAAEPERGRQLFDALARACEAAGLRPALGVFGAHMQVGLVNDGPVTFRLRVVP